MRMKKHAGTFVISLIVTALLVVLDQLTKILAVSFRKDAPTVLIPGVFELRYLENNGAAFGLLQNQHWLFYIITIVLSIAILVVLWKMPTDKKYVWLRICGIGILAGAFGNFIDRVSHHYVVDFLYFSLIDFPIFNVADIYVTCSAILAFVLILFVYKDDDLNFLSGKKEKKQ